MPGAFGGSSGYTSAYRVDRVIEEFFSLPDASRTSARFDTIWSSRAVHYRDAHLDYLVGGGEANTAAGWLNFLARVHESTGNSSTRSESGHLSLPSPAWRDFIADRATLQAETTAINGTTDAEIGRRLYQFLVSTVIESGNYRRGGQHREILVAWSAAGSSAAPTS